MPKKVINDLFSKRDRTPAEELEVWRSRRARIEQRLVELQRIASLTDEERVEHQWLEKEQVEIEKVIAHLSRRT